METLSEVLNIRLRPSDVRNLDRLRRGMEKGEFMRKLLDAEDARVKRRISDAQPVCSDLLHLAGSALIELFAKKLGAANIDFFLGVLAKALGNLPDAGDAKTAGAKPSKGGAAKQATPAEVPGSTPQSQGHDPMNGAVSPATTDSGFLRVLLSGKRNESLEALVQPTAVEENRRRGGGS